MQIVGILPVQPTLAFDGGVPLSPLGQRLMETGYGHAAPGHVQEITSTPNRVDGSRSQIQS